MEQLFFTTDFDRAKSEIRMSKGRITHQFTDAVFVAVLPDGTDVDALRHCSRTNPGKLDKLSQLLLDAWNKRSTKNISADKKGLSWDEEGFQHPKNPDNDPKLAIYYRQQKKSIRSTGTPTSETMTGSIAVGLILVGGTTDGLRFSDDENTLAISEVMEGCQFLATAGVHSNVSFVYTIHIVTINAVPNPGGCAAFDCESIMRDPALQQLGYPAGYNGCVNFVNDLRKARSTDWAYMAFITKYPLWHFAYAYGVNIYMEYSNDGWGPNLINQLFAHETCHIFGAADEYASSNCSCAPSGTYNVPNYNCINCDQPGYQKVPCLMNTNTLSLCELSKGQIGWPYWSGDVQVPNTGMSSGPSTVVFGDKTYCFHQGAANCGQLWYNVFDGTNWLGDKLVPNTGMSSGPAAIVFNGKIYCFHQGAANCGQLWYNVFDGTNWLGDKLVPNTGMSSSPAVVVFNGKIYCFHQGAANCGQLWYNAFDGTNWSGDVLVPNTGMSSGPSVVVFNGKIYCFHQGAANCGQLWYNVFDGTNWSGDVQVPNTGMSSGPSVVVFNGKIYCFHQGAANCGQLWYNVFDGTNWLGDIQVTNLGISDSPSAAIVGNQIYCFHQGYANCGQLWYNVLTVN